MNEWQDIETAPKGVPVLIWDKAQSAHRVAFFGTAIEDGSQAWIYARQLSWQRDDGGLAIAFVAAEPTHWQPLPDPPEAA